MKRLLKLLARLLPCRHIEPGWYCGARIYFVSAEPVNGGEVMKEARKRFTGWKRITITQMSEKVWDVDVLVGDNPTE